MSFEFRQQPIKTLYFLYSAVAILFFRLPFWIAISLFPSWRPRSSWPLSRTVIVHGMRAFVTVIYKAGYQFLLVDPEQTAKSDGSGGFVWVQPIPQDFVRGQVAVAAKVNNVLPARVSGFWYQQGNNSSIHGQRALPNEKVLYALHGGAYIMETASPKGSSTPVIKGILQECAQVVGRAFSLEYRLASAAPFKACNPWPAALLDALAGYRYLVEDVGFAPENVVVVGDSAGGHLAVALVRYLNLEKIPSLPLPRAVILLSPTVDWACTHVGPDSSMVKNSQSDFTGEILTCGYTPRALLGSLPSEEIDSVWISPASLHLNNTAGLFSGFPPTCMINGGAEQTVDPMRTLRDRLVADNGVKQIHYIEYPDAIHDFITQVWHEPERSEGLRDIKAWLETLY